MQRQSSCHDYRVPARDEFVQRIAGATKRADNIRVGEGVGAAEFGAMCTARNATLNRPQLILPAEQVNMRAGQLPPVEHNAVRYMKIPPDQL